MQNDGNASEFKHFCSYCGDSADVDGSRCYKGKFSCPKHERRLLIETIRLSDRRYGK